MLILSGHLCNIWSIVALECSENWNKIFRQKKVLDVIFVSFFFSSWCHLSLGKKYPCICPQTMVIFQYSTWCSSEQKVEFFQYRLLFLFIPSSTFIRHDCTDIFNTMTMQKSLFHLCLADWKMLKCVRLRNKNTIKPVNQSV